MLFKRLFIFFLFIVGLGFSQDVAENLLKGGFVEGITVNLRNPTFCEGVLTTEQGGVITGPNLRIQAQKIEYIRKVIEGQPVCTIVAEGDIMMEFGDYIFVGEQLEYDFQTGTGCLTCARSGIDAWYLGGEKIYMYADGSYRVTCGFITTSDSTCPDWYLTAEEATLYDYREVCAKNIRFRLFNYTLFWLPSLALDLKAIADSPARYFVGWGGRQGPRVGMTYKILSYNRLKVFLRMDYRLTRGPGFGFQTFYRSEDRKESFESISYGARDSSIFHPSEKFRYRLQGIYHKEVWDDRFSIDLTYDKLSDKYMAVDYADQSLDIALAGRTELDIRRQETEWIANLVTRVRINAFETVKQELPTLQTNWKPFELGRSGVISENQVQLSYLDFAYSNNVTHVHDYSAGRVAYTQKLYRPTPLGPVTITPQVGSISIFYGDSPQRDAKWLVMGSFGGEINAPIYRFYNSTTKHVILPYARYQYLTFPTVSPQDHFIFDIDDGLYRLNMLRFGNTHSLYYKDNCGLVERRFFADLYANAFFDTKTIPTTIPKVYLQMVLNSSPHLRHYIDTAWDFQVHRLDHFNCRIEWTISEEFAISAEYRYRDPFDWRKADRDNFILESFRPIEELLHSPLSDPCQTALIHFFYRFHPNWAVEYEARHGWNRRDHTRFTEFEIDILTAIRSSIQMKLSYQHKESEDRIAISFSIWPQGPDHERENDYVPFLNF